MAGDGCRSQGPRNSEKALAPLPQSGVATANGKPEPPSVSWWLVLGTSWLWRICISHSFNKYFWPISHYKGQPRLPCFSFGLSSAPVKQMLRAGTNCVYKLWMSSHSMPRGRGRWFPSELLGLRVLETVPKGREVFVMLFPKSWDVEGPSGWLSLSSSLYFSLSSPLILIGYSEAPLLNELWPIASEKIAHRTGPC